APQGVTINVTLQNENGAGLIRSDAQIAQALARAAMDGKITLQDLAAAVLAAVNAAAGSNGSSGLGAAISSAVSSVFSGGRAEGGPVLGGGAYLVGERGPEVFRPHGSGAIESAAPQGVTINVTLQNENGAGLIRSDAQIAQALARAVSLGARRL
ncbi:MAG: hypothetical protein ACXWVH_06000, partial [Caulobacteraceae bacterium]